MAIIDRTELLEKLKKQYNEAARNPGFSRMQIRDLYFELNCLRQQLETLDEGELALLDE